MFTFKASDQNTKVITENINLGKLDIAGTPRLEREFIAAELIAKEHQRYRLHIVVLSEIQLVDGGNLKEAGGGLIFFWIIGNFNASERTTTGKGCTRKKRYR